MSKSDSALEALQKFEPAQRLAILEALDKKRREDCFIKYWEPQEQQLPHFKQFTRDVKIFGILGGNRSGKTEEGVFIDVAWALGKNYFKGEPAWEIVKDLPIPDPPNTIWIVGLSYDVLKLVIWYEKLRRGRGHPQFLPNDPEVIEKIVDGEFQVHFTNGSLIVGKSADAGRDKFQGASVDLVHIDEECEVAVFDECYQRTADCAGKILLTLTPLVDVASGVRTPWVFDLYDEMNQGRKDVVFVKLNVLANPYVPQEEKTKLIEKWAGHFEEKARLYGDFIQRAGLIYPHWDPKVHCIDLPKIPREWRRLVSIDPAATGTTAALWGAIEPGTNNVYLYREYYQSNATVSDHAKSILLLNGSDPIDIWMLDPKWASQRNAETHKTGLQLYRENGIPVRPASIDYEDYGLNVSREYIKATTEPTSNHPKIFFGKQLEHLKWEISRYTWDFFSKGEQKGLSKDKPVKRNDHLMNAMQYMLCMKPKAHKNRSHQYDEAGRKHFSELNSYT